MKKPLSIVSILLLTCFGILSCKTAENYQAFYKKLGRAIDSTMNSEMQKNHIPGAGVVIVKDGKTIYKQGYGISNVETGKKVDPDTTIFRIGSISKALTLLTLTKLIDDGRISSNDSIENFVDYLQNPDSIPQPVKIKHLLTHTSGLDQIGLDRHIFQYDLPLNERKEKRQSIDEFLRKRNLRLATPPGQYFRYDTYGTTLAGVLIEKVSGLSYPEAMKKELFKPLGMNRSFVETVPEYIGDLAVGHGYNDDKYEVMPYELYVTTPASSIDATVADVGRLLEVLTGDGSNEFGQFFSEQMADSILAPQFRPHPDFMGATHGLFEENQIGSDSDTYAVRTISHGGTMLGFRSHMILIPSLKIGVYYVANRNGEAGGGWFSLFGPLLKTVLHKYGFQKSQINYEVPKIDKTIDLNEYDGNYYYGVFCHTCSDLEYEDGAWRKPGPMVLTSKKGMLLLNDKDKYIYADKDIFIGEDGFDKLFFGRDDSNKITFFVRASESTSYEKIDD